MVDGPQGDDGQSHHNIQRKLVDFLSDPKVWLPIAVAVLAVVSSAVYNKYKPAIAREIAQMLVDKDNFRESSADGSEVVSNPLDSYIQSLISMRAKEVQFQASFFESLAEKQSANSALSEDVSEVVLSSFLRIEDGSEYHEALKDKIRALIDSELSRIHILESEYGRVDTIFTTTIELEARQGDPERPQSLSKDVKFMAEKTQQVLVRLEDHLYLGGSSGSTDSYRLSGLVVKGAQGVEPVRIAAPVLNDISHIVPFSNADGVQAVQIGIAPERPLPQGSRVVIEVTLVVRNALLGTGAMSPISVVQPGVLPND